MVGRAVLSAPLSVGQPGDGALNQYRSKSSQAATIFRSAAILAAACDQGEALRKADPRYFGAAAPRMGALRFGRGFAALRTARPTFRFMERVGVKGVSVRSRLQWEKFCADCDDFSRY